MKMGYMVQLRRASRILASCLVAGSLLLAVRFADSAPSLRSDEWPKTARAFQQALASGNPEALDKAAKAVVADNSKRSVELVLKALRTAGVPSYWLLIGALGKASSEESLAAIGEEILAGKVPELRRDLIMSLRLCESASAGPVLRRILKEGTPDLQVSAMDEVVDRLDLEAVPLLLDIAEKDPKGEREITRRVFRALRCIAKDLPKGAPPEWRRWWDDLIKAGPVGAKYSKMQPGSVGQTVVETLRPIRSTQFEDLKKVDKDQILVMSGEYDKVEDVLLRFEIPHTTITFAALKAIKGPSLARASALFLNCGAIGDWPEAQVQQVQDYVGQGGYLFVSDLGVQHLIRHAFPGFMQFKAGNLSSQSIAIYPAKGSTGHSFMRGVEVLWSGSSRLTWQIDEGGPTLQFDEKKVISLVESPELAQKRKPPSVAVTFAYTTEKQSSPEQALLYGGVVDDMTSAGKVLCVLSHFKNQRQGEDGFALQNLLINFLIEARDRKLMREDAANRKK